jgi:hypothetical protein
MAQGCTHADSSDNNRRRARFVKVERVLGCICACVLDPEKDRETGHLI